MLSIFPTKNAYANITICNEETYEQLMLVLHVLQKAAQGLGIIRGRYNCIIYLSALHKDMGQEQHRCASTVCLQKSHWPHFLFFWERLHILQHPASSATPAFTPCLPRESNFG